MDRHAPRFPGHPLSVGSCDLRPATCEVCGASGTALQARTTPGPAAPVAALS